MLLGLIVSVVIGVLLLFLLYGIAFYFIDQEKFTAAGLMGILIVLTYLGAGLSTLIYFVLWIKSLF